MSTFIFLLLGFECILALALFHRRIHEYPITCMVQVIVAGLYGMLMIEYFGRGPWAYYHAVYAWWPVFSLASAIVCIESVWLMAQGIPNVRWFAAATSLVFAVLSGLAMLAAEQIVPGTRLKWPMLWPFGTLAYLTLNRWLYQRGKPLNPLAARHALGAVFLIGGTVAALGLAAWSRGLPEREWMRVAGQIVGRAGPIVGLLVWIRKERT